MSNLFISFVAGAAAAGWVYSRFARSTGGNTKSAVSIASVVGILVLMAAYAGLYFIS